MQKAKEFSIYLGGGGGSSASAALDTVFFGNLPADGTILYIPVALESDRFPSALEWFSGVVRRYSQTLKIEMLTDNHAGIIDFSKYDAVYMGGGNVYKLLDFIVKQNLGRKLKDFIKSGKAVYGGSAGAIILGKSVNVASEMDERGNYKYDEGLDLFQGACIACHWPQTDDYVRKFAAENKCRVYCIPENCGLIFDSNGNLVKTIGEGVEVLREKLFG